MAVPPVAGTPANPSKPIEQPQIVGGEGPINPGVGALARHLNSLSNRPSSLERDVIQLVEDTGIRFPLKKEEKPWEESGPFEYVPRELIQVVHKELDTLKIYKWPTQSKQDVAGCIEQMKLSWKAPDGTPADQMIFGTVNIKKFAGWVDANKVPVSKLPSLGDEDLKNLLPQLEYLDLTGSEFTKFELLKTCRNLKHLGLSRCDSLTDANFQHMATLTGLTSLNVSGGYQLTDAGFAHITTLTGLTSLNVNNCKGLTDAGLEHIAVTLTGLTSLNVSCCNLLTDAGFQHIAVTLTGLTSLTVSCCDLLADTSFQHIAKLKKLTSLNISGCNLLTETSFQHIAKLKRLTFLKASYYPNFTDTGLQHIAKLTRLTFLDISEWKITDAGLEYITTTLKELCSLIVLNCPHLSIEGRKRLEAKLPALGIKTR